MTSTHSSDPSDADPPESNAPSPTDSSSDAELAATHPWSVELPTRRATLHLAKRFAKHVRIGDLVILVGPLGAGKTFFVRGLARALGLPAAEPVTSPTFALVQELPTAVPLVHADLYRLTKPDELAQLGLRQARDTACLFVEWGAPYLEALGGDGLVLELTRTPRSAHLTATGPRSRELLQALRQ